MMTTRLRSLAAFSFAMTWATDALAKPKWLADLTRFDGMLSTEQFAVLGAILVVIAIIAAKLEKSALVIGIAAIGGVLCLTTAGVMSFLAPEARRTGVIISEKAHHKKDVGGTCNTTSDCMHGDLCANVHNENRCWRKCGKDDLCPKPMACIPSESGVKVCAF